MKKTKPEALLSLIFFPLLALIFIRPFLSDLAYPATEIYYQGLLMLFAIPGLLLNKTARPQDVYNRPLLALLLAYLLSTALSISMQNSIRETIKIATCMCIFFAVSLADEKQKKLLIKTIVAASLIISLYSIYQYFWGYRSTLDYLKKINSSLLLTSSYAKDILIAKRSIGTFPSPNILGGYLIMALFLSLSIVENKDGSRAWYLAPVLITTALILTKSLGAWLSFVSAFFIFFLLSCKSFRHKKTMAAIFVVFIITALSFIMLSRQERLLDLDNPQSSFTQRVGYWRTALGIIKDHFITGVGPGSFQEVFLNYKVGTGTDTRYAHNVLLHQWSETGMTGAIAIIFIIKSFMSRAFLKSKYIFLAGLAFMLHNLVDATYFISQAGLFWWVIMGLSI